MRPTFWLIFMLFAASGVAGAAGTPVVKADTTTKNPVIDNNLTGNSSAFYLWSNLTGPNIARGGPNEFTDLFNPFGSIAKPIPETKSLITVGQKTYPDAGGKNVGKTKVDKPAPQAPQTAQDSSEALGDPNNTLYKVASEGKVMTGDKKQFSASAQRSTGALGSAAAVPTTRDSSPHRHSATIRCRFSIIPAPYRTYTLLMRRSVLQRQASIRR